MPKEKLNQLERLSPTTQKALGGLQRLADTLLHDGLRSYINAKLNEAMGNDQCYCGTKAEPVARKNPFTGDTYNSCNACSRIIQPPPKEHMTEEEAQAFIGAVRQRAEALKKAIDDALKYSLFHHP